MKKAAVKKAAPKKTVKKTSSKKQVQKEELAPVPTQQNPQPPMGTPPMGANGPMMRKGGKIQKAFLGKVLKGGLGKSLLGKASGLLGDGITKKLGSMVGGSMGSVMRKGGKIKKSQGGGPVKDTTKVSYETSPFTKAKQNKATGVVVPKKNEKEEFTYLRNSEKTAAKKSLTGKKAQGGTKFGALSVKAGVDDNYGITAADRISGAKMNKGKAKSGTKMKMGGTIKKAQGGTMETPPSRIQSTNQKVQSNVNKIATKNAGDSLQKSAAGTAKNGKSMKKCKYGCK